MAFDRPASIRRIKPQRRAASLVRRKDADLPLQAGAGALLDQAVFELPQGAEQMEDQTPSDVIVSIASAMEQKAPRDPGRDWPRPGGAVD